MCTLSIRRKKVNACAPNLEILCGGAKESPRSLMQNGFLVETHTYTRQRTLPWNEFFETKKKTISPLFAPFLWKLAQEEGGALATARDRSQGRFMYRQNTAPERRPCPYGRGCFATNPSHHALFSHDSAPPREERIGGASVVLDLVGDGERKPGGLIRRGVFGVAVFELTKVC